MLSLSTDLAGNAAGLSGAMIEAGGDGFGTLTGQILRPENAAPMLLALLLAACLIGLMAALWLWHSAGRARRATWATGHRDNCPRRRPPGSTAF